MVSIEKPLCPGFHDKRMDDNINWVTVKYEKMADICYKCGALGHLSHFCSFECPIDETKTVLGNSNSDLD